MSQKLDLKEIERKAWTSYFEDGLWDIFLGLLMLTGGIRGLTDNLWSYLILLAAVLIPALGKKFITIPRIGLVKFGPARKVKRERLATVLVISVLALFALLLLPRSGVALPRIPISPIVAVFYAGIFGAVAYYMDFGRLYAYGLLFAISEVLWGLFGKPIGPMVDTVLGIVILLIGVVVFVRFLRKYPLPADEALDVNS